MKRKTATVDKTQPESQPPEATGDLSAQQQAALTALLTCPTLAEAGERARVSQATLWRYMQDETFARHLREARREIISHAVLRLQHAAGDAVQVLHNIVNNEAAGYPVRVTAARAILDMTFRVVEQDELKARIGELERHILLKQEEDALDRGRKAASDDDEDED
jgi:hypothetical protein